MTDLFSSRPMQKEQEYLTALVSLSLNRNVALDIGANVGLVSKILSPHFECVYSFEAIPDIFNAEEENVVFFNDLLSEDYGEIDFIIPDPESERFKAKSVLSKVGTPDSDQHSIRLKTYPLDHFNFPEVNMMKLDVEDHELQVLMGAKETIDRCSPVIGIEAHPPYLSAILRYMREVHEYNTVKVFDHENYILLK